MSSLTFHFVLFTFNGLCLFAFQSRLFAVVFYTRQIGSPFMGITLDKAFPQIALDGTRVSLDTLTFKILADALDVAFQNKEGVAVTPAVRHLGEVDEGDLTFPVEDVIG